MLGWIGLLAAACAGANASGETHGDIAATFVASGHHQELAQNFAHGHHHDSERSGHALEADCCCDLTAVFGSPSSNTAKFVMLPAVLPHPELVQPVIVSQLLDACQEIEPHETSPPIYLITQRFRI